MRRPRRTALALTATTTALLVGAAAWLLILGAAPAGAGGYSSTQIAPPRGISLAGSAYRWQAFGVGTEPGRRMTVVERVDRRGGVVGEHWELHGAWHLAAPAYDGEGAGLTRDESMLVLQRYDPTTRDGIRHRSHFAVLEPRSRRARGAHPFRRFALPGDYLVSAISPDGGTLFLVHTLFFSRARAQPRFEPAAYDLQAGRLLPRTAIRDNGEVLAGTNVARVQDASGRHVYSLYIEAKGRMYVLGLDTVRPSLALASLPGLRHLRNPFALDLRIDAGSHRLFVERGETIVARLGLHRFSVPRPAATISRTDPVGVFADVVGHSRGGLPIELEEVGDLALPMRVLAFGCVHGDECGAARIEPLRGGCPDGHTHVDVVPNLDPDGSARRSRLNGRGVDLNRNFPVAWRPLDRGGGPEYSGPRPFSEPETRLAARLIRRLEPRVTLWFHQHWGAGSYVRAWGQSVPAARRFAKLAGIGFRLEHWEAGTAPHWQNRRFPGTASFVVELSRGKLPQARLIRLDEALGRLGEEVGDHPPVARKG